MDFFNKLGNIASDTYKKTSEKTTKIAKETKTKLKISDNKSKIKDLYEEIGKLIYQKHVREEEIAIDDDISSHCKEIDELSKEIENYQSEILAMREKKICTNCNAEIEKSSNYCANCGAEQPKIEEEEKPEEDNEEVKEAEVVEEKTENGEN